MKRSKDITLALAAVLLAVTLAGSLIPQAQTPEAVPAFAADAGAGLSPTAAVIENLFSIEPVRSSAPAAESPTPAPTHIEAPTDDGFGITVLSGADRRPRLSVLIYHTHTYEAYERQSPDEYVETERWRTADERHNTVRVGRELAALLRALGLEVTHDATAFEPPDLAGAYSRSLDMLRARQAAGEHYDLYIDLHRDAYAASQTEANTVNIGGTDTARLMLLVGKGEGQTAEGFDEKPDWQGNLALAQAVTDALNAQTDGLCKSVRIKSGRFNQHAGPRCVLVEAGNNRNTLAEALAAMPYLADAIADTLRDAVN